MFMYGYNIKYFLKSSWQEEYTEVTEKEFVRAEGAAGFHPKPGLVPVATGGFSSGNISGKVEYTKKEMG